MYTIIRLAACVIVPCSIFCAPAVVWWAIAVAAVLGALFFLLDYRAPGRAGLPLPARRIPRARAHPPAGIGLVYPTIQTIFQSFMNSAARVRRIRQLRLDLHPAAEPARSSSTRSSGCSSCPIVSTIAASPTPSSSTSRAARSSTRSWSSCRWRSRSSARRIIWRFMYDRPPRRARADRLAQPGRSSGSAGSRSTSCSRSPWNTLLPHRRADLGADRIRDGRALRGDQGRPDRAARGGASSTAPTRWQRFINVTFPASARRSSSC